jgi:hydrogenase expression/formation protein HypD
MKRRLKRHCSCGGKFCRQQNKPRVTLNLYRFSDSDIADLVTKRLKSLGLNLRLMHVCGTHQDTITRNGLDSIFSKCGIEMRSGPGCPVCVTPVREFEEAKALAKSGCMVTVFGDAFRVPSGSVSLSDLRSEGCDVRIVYGIEDAVKLAESTRKHVVFMAMGFETTAPTTASVILKGPPENLSILSCHRYVPPVLDALLGIGELKLHGLVDPGHVSVIIGIKPYEDLTAKYNLPQVIAGFEPLDVLMAVWMLAKQVKNGEVKVENEYIRVVKNEGNVKALDIMNRVFEPRDVVWRGFGVIKGSGMTPKKRFQNYDTRRIFEDELREVEEAEYEEPVGCRCNEVIRGLTYPHECPLFAKVCTPSSPVGACMVSIEGSCSIDFRLGQRGV